MGMIPPQCIIHVKAYLTIMYFFFFLFCIRSVTTLQPYVNIRMSTHHPRLQGANDFP
jgi:hypothetical protein